MSLFNPFKFFSKILKSSNSRELEKLNKLVIMINEYEKEILKFSEKDFKNKTQELIKKVESKESLEKILPIAFAMVREASKRVNNERHFDVQLLGGIVLHQNKIAEMKTGEGKTLTIVLAAYLNALEKKGVHIVTVNDYLAKRDSENMGKIYSYLGLSCGYINSGQTDEERKYNYSCDITYATNSELGFDYLRDNMKFSNSEKVQRGQYFAIVDEIDSCLIDEARTPLVISGSSEDKTAQYYAINKLIKNLKKSDYEIDEKERNILLTNEGIDNIEKILIKSNILKNNNFYDPANLHLVHYVNQALRANHLFENGKDYIIKDNQIIIIDEQTGRQLPGRRYGDGLHQSLEAKENLEIQSENQTLASTSYQNYFKLYKKLAGCTGTAYTESEEFYEIYNLLVVIIPTNKQMIRKDLNDTIYRTTKEKDDAIINKIIECNKKGQPLLIFTASVNKSEHYSNMLRQKKISHTVLNAKNHEKEAEIIANAGKKNSVIITTSISGRGVDIKLGGYKSSLEEKLLIKELGGLFVIGTERMESRRVDNQARGRSGRQGDEGSSIFYVSLEDDLMRIFGSDSMNNILEKLGLKDGESIDHPWINKALEGAQKKVEGRNFDIRKTLLKFDNVLNDQRMVIFQQRDKVMDEKNVESYADIFIEETVNELDDKRKLYKQNPNQNSFQSNLKSIIGKNIKDDEISNYHNLSSDKFKEEILKKYENLKQQRIDLIGKENNNEIERKILIQIIDQNWKFHIQYLEQLRQVIGLRSYGQKDPLIEYKKEAFSVFENLLYKIKNDYLSLLFNLKLVEKPSDKKQIDNQNIDPKYIGKKLRRNEPCFCGSKKKYKHCCGAQL